MIKNRNVELCYFEENNDNLMIRVSGKVHFINNNKDLINRLLLDRPFLKELYGKEKPEDIYGIFMLKKDEITIR
jgi:uncharacterized pyridoxamine 5'-phosphate oxidase family protein